MKIIMSQKLLQKNGNRYLQQFFPENLTPRKRIGKREKYKSNSGMYSIKISSRGESIGMEKELRNQWVFFWNTLKKESVITREKVVLPLSAYKIPHLLPKSLMAPIAYKGYHQINRAVGGNIISHLNQSISRQPPTGVKYAIQGSAGGVSRFVDLVDKNTQRKVQQRDSVPLTVADLVRKQIDLNFWFSFYSIQEKEKFGVKREKIGEDYKNQLAECKKVAMLYGNLPKKTLVRAMRQAKKEGGDIDSQFFSYLERRLDVALNRALFFSTIKSARQWIRRRQILVNNCTITTPSYLLQPGDVLTISPSARTVWRKQFLQWIHPLILAAHLSLLDNNTIYARGGNLKAQGNRVGKPLLTQSTVTKNEHYEIQPTASLVPFEKSKVAIQRRYPFSPRLMRKWGRWSKLWGNSPQTSGKHVFQQLVDNSELHSPHFFMSSSFFSTFDKTQSLAHRRKTKITRWLGARQGVRENGTQFFIPSRAKWLHQQQPHVVDGLYPCRWNRAFAKSKSIDQREYHWRWSCVKPLHLECSYKHYTAIFLYAPQKLAWPCSINVNLLRKALN